MNSNFIEMNDDISISSDLSEGITKDMHIIALENTIGELQQRVYELETTIDCMEKQSAKQAKRINGVFNVLYVLTSGLYCTTTQTDCHEFALSQLFECNTNNDNEDECVEEYIGEELSMFPKPSQTHKWNRLPTTRQGDSNERRIEMLEEKLKNMDQKLN